MTYLNIRRINPEITITDRNNVNKAVSAVLVGGSQILAYELPNVH